MSRRSPACQIKTKTTCGFEPSAVTAPLDAAVTTSAEAVTAVIPPVEAVSVAPVEAVVNPFAEAPSAPLVDAAPVVSSPIDNEELVAAKKKIAELEAQIAERSTFIQ